MLFMDFGWIRENASSIYMQARYKKAILITHEIHKN